ncbi:hypothetical protein M011DRAFT_413450 [Sporormia fimetaria CBS 119925]|uniref:MICOS complex subunit MIC12 n=1 Tax=Sporormia fimetaria CBS 119925 TaxID=1340428 RepID=A0A6A6UW48_9PLEO|nr:hypothetical protein M011DRAFT_413450 [Sporormia fimetaria CBS 119925]
MGFTTGFIGGITLTSSILYLTLSLHQQNRAAQATLLRQQRMLLNTIVEPPQRVPDPHPREVAVGLSEMAKDKWNRSLEGVVKRLYETDWRRERERVEDWLGGVVERVRK